MLYHLRLKPVSQTRARSNKLHEILKKIKSTMPKNVYLCLKNVNFHVRVNFMGQLICINFQPTTSITCHYKISIILFSCNENRIILITAESNKAKHEKLNMSPIKQGYSSLPNTRGARNKRGGGKDEPFLINVVPVINVEVRKMSHS